MVNNDYLLLGGLVAAGFALYYLRGNTQAASTAPAPAPVVNVSIPDSAGSATSSNILDRLLISLNAIPYEQITPNNTGGSQAVSPGVVAPVVTPQAPAPAPTASRIPLDSAGNKIPPNPYAGNPMFDPVIQAYSTDFANHNLNGGGQAWVTSVGGPEGYRAGNR